MSVLTPLKAIRNAYFGPQLTRAASTLPATASTNLFTVTGGRVLVTSIVGEVTTVTGATATVGTLEAVAGAVTTALATGASLASLPVGTLYAPSAVGAATTGAAVWQNNEIVVQAGTIRLTTNATNTGAMRWTINYIPLDDGATVAVA